MGPSGSGLYCSRSLGAMIEPGFALHELLILLDGHLLGGDGKAAGDDPAMGRLVGTPIRLVRG